MATGFKVQVHKSFHSQEEELLSIIGGVDCLKRLCGLLLSFLKMELGLEVFGHVQIWIRFPLTPNI